MIGLLSTMRRSARFFALAAAVTAASCSLLAPSKDDIVGTAPASGGDASADVSLGGSAGSGGTSGGGGAGGITDSGADSDASAGIPLDDLAAAMAKALCDNAEQCYGPGFEVETKGLDCQTQYEAQLEDTLIGMAKASVVNGAVTYDALAAAKCIADLEAATQSDAGISSCVDLRIFLEQCKAAFGTSKEAGDTCADAFECGSGMYCNDLSTCPGVCATLLGAGADCQTLKQCEPGLVCVKVSDAGTATCQPYAKPGESCKSLPPDLACAPGSLCSGDKCRLPLTLFSKTVTATCGGIFGADGLCGAGLACEFDGLPLASSGTCVVDTDHVGCRVSVPDSCGVGEYCDAAVGATGNCVSIPTSGGACANDAAQQYGFAAACADGLRCVAGKCTPVARIGEGCSNDVHCASNNCTSADAGSGTCALPYCE